MSKAEREQVSSQIMLHQKHYECMCLHWMAWMQGVCSNGKSTVRLAVQGLTLFTHSADTHVPNVGNTCFKSEMSNETVPPNMNVPFIKDVCSGQESTKHASIAALGVTTRKGVKLLHFVF